MNAGTVTQRSRATTPYDRSAARWRAPRRRAGRRNDRARRFGSPPPGATAGGAASVGARHRRGGAPVAPATGRTARAFGGGGAARANKSTAASEHAGHAVVSGLGSRRRDYTRDDPGRRGGLKRPRDATPMVCFAAICVRVSAGKHFENRDLFRATRCVMSCRQGRRADTGFARSLEAGRTTSAAISSSSASAKAGWRRCFARSRRGARVRARCSSSSASARAVRLTRSSSRCSARRRASRRCFTTRTSCRSTTSVRSTARTSWRWSTCAGKDLSTVMRALRGAGRGAAVAGGLRRARGGARASPRAHRRCCPTARRAASFTATSAPSNIMLLRAGGVKILDFGIAKAAALARRPAAAASAGWRASWPICRPSRCAARPSITVRTSSRWASCCGRWSRGSGCSRAKTSSTRCATC